MKSIRVPKASKIDAETSPAVPEASENDAEESSGVPAGVENDSDHNSQTTAMIVEEFTFDAALMREERELGEQAAREMGHRRNKVDHTLSGPKGGPLEVAIAEAARKVTPAEARSRSRANPSRDKDDSGSTDRTGDDSSDSGGVRKARLARGGLRALEPLH